MKKLPSINQVSALIMITLGIIFIVLSTYNTISFFAILGVSLFFWGSIILYIKPSRQIPITYLTASTTASMSNIERILTQLQIAEKGIYLPPKNLQDIESSLIFVPNTSKQSLPESKGTQTIIFSDKNKGIFLTPPGFTLTKIFEQTAELSFLNTRP